MTKLKDIFSKHITGEWGTDPSSKDSVYVLRTTNFTNEGIIDYSNVVQRDVPLAKVQNKQLCKDDIILEKSGGSDNIPVGRVVYCGDEIKEKTYLCNNFTQAMRVNTDIAVPKYVFHYMMFLHKTGRTNLLQRKTTGIRNLQIKSYLNLEIPLPSKARQLDIADILDKIDSLTKLNQQRINKLNMLVKSRFIEMFGNPIANSKHWNKESLDKLAYIKIGPFGSLLHKEDYIEGNFSLINPSHIIDYKIIPDRKFSITHEKYDELEPYQLKINDIVMGRRGEIGRAGLVKEEHLLCGTGSLFIRVNKKILPDFLHAVITFPLFRKSIEDMAVGQTMLNLNVKIVGSLSIILPPMNLQNEFISFINQIDKSKAEVQKSLAKLEVLKKSLMQEYFG